MKIGTYDILEVQICKSGLRFLKFRPPKPVFGQIWTEKLKVVQFGWKLAYRVFRRCWFLFHHGTHAHTHAHARTQTLIHVLLSILVFSNFKPIPWGSWFLYWDSFFIVAKSIKQSINKRMLDKVDYCCNQNLFYQKGFASTKTLKQNQDYI